MSRCAKRAVLRTPAQCLIILLVLLNMIYSVQFRKKKGHFWFGFVEAHQVFSCFPSDRSSQVFKRNIFRGFIPAAVTVSLSSKAGQHLCGNFSSSDGKLMFSKHLKCVKLL